ncbi:nucleolin-like isoform X2 [Melanotaenia boesemani]|uniref:nucleolin-like isoform X2 n=1 Tax=Melanotaenia boesemani TaxID=1250792 RepID=UPI001C04EE4B|nr:nucleolin-like isoform X2 [Melanotaenia boesemani]
MAKTDSTRGKKRPSKADEGQIETFSSSELMLTDESTEVEMKREEEGDEQESQKDTIDKDDENTPAVAETKKKRKKKRKAGREGDGTEEKSSGSEDKAVNGKQKTEPATEASPSKKTKLINDGFCLFIGNLDTSKTADEIKNSLANYLMKQSLLFQDVRLDRTRKHAFVDLASEIDLTKALTLDGKELLNKPMKISKAKVKCVDEGKKKTPLDKKVRDGRCLFLKNLPYDATKADILKIFHKAIAVRFPGGTKGPSKGIAFVKFKNTKVVKKILEKKRQPQIQGRVLIVDSVGESNVVTVKSENNGTNAPAPPSSSLFVSNLSFKVKEKHLKDVFQKAVGISIPKAQGKARGYAFVDFATVKEAEKAFQSAQNIEICKRPPRMEFCDSRPKPEKGNELSKTLIVAGLAEKTTAETLHKAFEGSLSARVIAKNDSVISKRFGFVEFESEESCRAVREAMEDCEIDGVKVTVAYAKPRGEGGRPDARKALGKRPRGKSSGAAVHKGKQGGNGKKGKGKKRGPGVSQDAVKEVKNKN